MYVVKRLFVVLLMLGSTGCAGTVERWIVDTRVHQGDTAMARGTARDAEVAYRLALKVDPKNARARAGLVEATSALGRQLYQAGDFDDALVTIEEGLKVDPTSVTLSSMKTTIDDAKLKREIVISNYPTYREAGAQLAKAYEQLDIANKGILANLKRFSYTYDTRDLTTAIKRSYALELDVARNTNRLITYRQVVSAGIPETATKSESGPGAGSLLPLP